MAYRLASTPVQQKGVRHKRVVSDAQGQRRPRERDRDHLGCVAQLPCVVCESSPVHVAHVRYASAVDNAPLVGKQEKPDDSRTVPLCPAHHTDGPDAQHKSGEAIWWREVGINPYALARALYGCSGDVELMRQLVTRARMMFPARTE